MLSKNKVKYFSSFQKKKARTEENVFIVEGNKLVDELLQTDFKIRSIVALPSWKASQKKHNLSYEFIEADNEDLAKISLLQTPQDVWALVDCKENTPITLPKNNELIIALDGVQDPGNLGTIIRLADWFGISQIWCSNQCADIYNPKVVQATMGAIFRVKVSYVELPQVFSSITNIDIFAAELHGENIYTATLPKSGILVMGNEGSGISTEALKYITRTLHIPTFNDSGKCSESLNVATATAILCSEFKRRKF